MIRIVNFRPHTLTGDPKGKHVSIVDVEADSPRDQFRNHLVLECIDNIPATITGNKETGARVGLVHAVQQTVFIGRTGICCRVRSLGNDDGVVLCTFCRFKQLDAGIHDRCVFRSELCLRQREHRHGFAGVAAITHTPLGFQRIQLGLHRGVAIGRTFKERNDKIFGCGRNSIRTARFLCLNDALLDVVHLRCGQDGTILEILFGVAHIILLCSMLLCLKLHFQE